VRVGLLRSPVAVVLAVCLRLAWPVGQGLALPAAGATARQEDSEQARPSDRFFSGMVTDFTPVTLTVSRAVLGKDPVKRVFVIASDTTIEGRLRTSARVTVRFIPCSEGDRALHIIVRTPREK
jgi:hypothetical protein